MKKGFVVFFGEVLVVVLFVDGLQYVLWQSKCVQVDIGVVVVGGDVVVVEVLVQCFQWKVMQVFVG